LDENKYKNMNSQLLIDATSHIAGRLASIVAKLILEGKQVVIINAEKSLISGRRNSVILEWLKKLEVSSITNPKHGPFHPRTPNGILTRMIRGMIPRRKPKGKNAMKKLRVYTGTPEKYLQINKIVYDIAKAKKPTPYYISLAEIASRIGRNT
jgi:large subunit ribosomal protein L13